MKISIITVVCGNSTVIADAIASVLDQDHPDVELIVIDCARDDRTLKAIQPYAEKITHLLSEPDRGAYDAMNKGLLLASGEVIGFLHSDDLYADHLVLSRIASTMTNPAVDACYSDMYYVCQDDLSRVIRYWKSCPYHTHLLRKGWMPPHPTLYVRRLFYQRLGSFNLRYQIAADYDWMLRFLSTNGIRCEYIPEALVHMRMGGMSNRSLGKILRKSYEDYLILRQNRMGGLLTLLRKNIQKIGNFHSQCYHWNPK